jgi:hypothetical protein
MRRRALIAGFAATLLTAGCALAPDFKTFRLSHREWRGAALTERGRLVIADAVAGAAPRTVTVIEIGGVLSLPSDPVARRQILERRVWSAAAELERDGVAAADIGVETRAVAEGAEREPSGALLARRFVIIAHDE